tara:strand:- start:546 stop:1583 length:1038 start_codon:yes stop_codon:yes gene_type:complete
MKKKILFYLGIFTASLSLQAQGSFETILLADKTDSEKLMEAYFSPVIEGFISAMNSGWYHTAKVHKPFGFDLSIGASGAFIPSEKEVFNIAALNLNTVTSSSTTASTFAGPSSTTLMAVNTIINGQAVSTDFNFPGGALEDLPGNAVPAPIVQLNVGLPWKLEAMLRFVPEISIGDNDGAINLFGLGFKKEITDWFGPLDKTPLHISLLTAYTTMNVDYGIGDVTSSNLEIRNGSSQFKLSSFTLQAIASVNFPFINFHGGFGYNQGTSSYEMKGTYTGIYETGLAVPNDTVKASLEIPSNLDFKSNGIAATLGTRLSLGFFKLYGSYTLQEYNTVNLGIAISIR